MRFLLVAVLAFSLAASASTAPAPNTQKRIEGLILDLDRDSVKVREEATRALERLGAQAVPALEEALGKKNVPPEMAQRIRDILQVINPVFTGHSNGWHWVYADLAQGQTFRATGTTIRQVKLRVARMNRNQPAAALDVEIRDTSLNRIYLRGHILAADSTLRFRWHAVKLDHVADLKEGETYQMLFHSRGTAAKACWAVNAIYKDTYPHGRANQHAHEDFFFTIVFGNGRTLRVGPEGENTTQDLPINSGNTGGVPFGNGKLTLAGWGELPAGQTMPASGSRPTKR